VHEAGFDALKQELSAHEAWNVVPPEQPYGSLDALLEAEIGYTEHEVRQTFVARQTSQGERSDILESGKSTQRVRANQNGIGLDSQRKLDYLASHHPALLAHVQAGEVSIHKAYVQARALPERTPLDVLRRAWRQASPDEQRQFLAEVAPTL
jgi:hypothetical protein